jgi:hypothetical protein
MAQIYTRLIKPGRILRPGFYRIDCRVDYGRFGMIVCGVWKVAAFTDCFNVGVVVP